MVFLCCTGGILKFICVLVALLEVNINGVELEVTREVDDGLETIKMSTPAVITADLRLNEPRFASIRNIMMAKK